MYEVAPGLQIASVTEAYTRLLDRTAPPQWQLLDVRDRQAMPLRLPHERVSTPRPLRRPVFHRVSMPLLGAAADLFAILPKCFAVLERTASATTTTIVCDETGTNQGVAVCVAYLIVVRGASLRAAVATILQSAEAALGLGPTTVSLLFGTQALRHDLTPAPEPGYLRKLMEIEASFRKGAPPSYEDLGALVDAFYGSGSEAHSRRQAQPGKGAAPLLGVPAGAREPSFTAKSPSLPVCRRRGFIVETAHEAAHPTAKPRNNLYKYNDYTRQEEPIMRLVRACTFTN
eukprot:TRINITY_DN5460_c0_g1_i1.p1 TRINITY_DN5460_c0_g1~~TRINITY_DN5460_c0_g1_i1.p1  ORF type:complete len:287 (-),score=62.50 TRINITY_DN5460_c0_g1_i1:56-916(-)